MGVIPLLHVLHNLAFSQDLQVKGHLLAILSDPFAIINILKYNIYILL